MQNDKYARIWELIKKASPNEKIEIINKLSDEDLIQLRYLSNPYRLPLYKSTAKFLEFSIINTQRDYITNLIMTSMVGFIYKMATEYKHFDKNKIDLPSENTGQFASVLNENLKAFNLKKLENYYKDIYIKTENLVDKARYLRAQTVVLKKQYDSETNTQKREELNNKIESHEKYVRSFCQENKIVYEAVFPTEVQITPEDIINVKNDTKKQLGVSKTLEENETEIQDYILDFLDEHFNFDPNNHIKCGYMPHYDEKIKGNEHNFKIAENQMLVTDKFEQYLVPPLDTFHSFRNYFDTNYEYLRQCTNDIYGKTDFEFAIIAREVFNDESKAKKWETKYADELDVSCHRIMFNEWVFLDPWEKNRESITYNDEKTKLIKEILERKKEEEKLGRQLIGKKAKKMKGAVKDKLPFTSQAEDLGVEHISKIAKENEVLRKESDVEIKVHSTHLVRKKRGVTQQMDNFSFDIPPQKDK